MRVSNDDAITDSRVIEGLNTAYLKLFSVREAVNIFRTTGQRNIKFSCILWFSIITIAPFIFFQIVGLFVIKMNLKTLIYIFINGMPSINIISKMLIFWFKFPEQCKLLDLIKGDLLSSIPRHKQPLAQSIYMKSAKKYNSYFFFAGVMRMLGEAAWVFFPPVLLANGRKKIMGGWYPFPYWESPWFEVVYVYEAFVMIWHGTFLLTFECMIVQLLVVLHAHFSVLGYHAETLKKEDVVFVGGTADTKKSEMTSAFLQKELEGIMRDYNKLLSYGDPLKEVYSIQVTILFGTGITACVIVNVYLILTTEYNPATVNFVLFFFYTSLEMTIICYCSTLVETASTDLQFSLYSSEWYEAGKKYKGALQMLMIKASKPLGLVVFRLYPVNMEIVIAMFRFIYSTGAVLSKMKES